jgi:hypothetical protein
MTPVPRRSIVSLIHRWNVRDKFSQGLGKISESARIEDGLSFVLSDDHGDRWGLEPSDICVRELSVSKVVLASLTSRRLFP